LPRRASGGAAAAAIDAAPIFAALGDETRLQLVSRLCAAGAMSVTRLSDGAAISRQAITKHLRVLEAAGLTRVTRQGRESVWVVELSRLDAARHYLDVISKQWDDTLHRLKQFVEE
jgi:DNA-binding transcriptional ArsR family regulator